MHESSQGQKLPVITKSNVETEALSLAKDLVSVGARGARSSIFKAVVSIWHALRCVKFNTWVDHSLDKLYVCTHTHIHDQYCVVQGGAVWKCAIESHTTKEFQSNIR